MRLWRDGAWRLETSQSLVVWCESTTKGMSHGTRTSGRTLPASSMRFLRLLFRPVRSSLYNTTLVLTAAKPTASWEGWILTVNLTFFHFAVQESPSFILNTSRRKSPSWKLKTQTRESTLCVFRGWHLIIVHTVQSKRRYWCVYSASTICTGTWSWSRTRSRKKISCVFEKGPKFQNTVKRARYSIITAPTWMRYDYLHEWILS